MRGRNWSRFRMWDLMLDEVALGLYLKRWIQWKMSIDRFVFFFSI